MYQKCPICNGTGNDPNKDITTKGNNCETCGGMRIIHQDTGRPPKHDGQMCPHDESKIKLC